MLLLFFPVLYINYSSLNYFPRDLSTKKGKRKREKETRPSHANVRRNYSTSLDPVARASLHRKRSNRPLPSLITFITILSRYLRIQLCRLFPYTETRRRRARCILCLFFVIINIFLFLFNYLYIYISNKLYIY